MSRTYAAGVRSEHSTGAAVRPAPRSARPVHGKVFPKATGLPVSLGLVVCSVECGVGGGPCKDPAACVVCIRHLMDKLKAAFKEVMQPQQNRQLESDTLVKTMKVHTVHFYVCAVRAYSDGWQTTLPCMCCEWYRRND